MTLLDTFFRDMYTNSVAYNLIRSGDSELILELNVVGIPENDVDVEVSGNTLTVSASVADEKEYLHRGIYPKSFKHSFRLRDDMVVKGATVKNGLLSVTLELQIPEEKKPRKILITH
jgi:molecular chaperone IbpA